MSFIIKKITQLYFNLSSSHRNIIVEGFNFFSFVLLIATSQDFFFFPIPVGLPKMTMHIKFSNVSIVQHFISFFLSFIFFFDFSINNILVQATEKQTLRQNLSKIFSLIAIPGNINKVVVKKDRERRQCRGQLEFNQLGICGMLKMHLYQLR